MKKFIIAVMFTASLIGLVACSSDKSDSDVVVKTKVGNITKDEFYEELKKNAGAEQLQNMIIIKVLEDKYKVTDKDVDARIEQFKAEQGDQFDMWLLQMGITDINDEVFRDQVYNLTLQEKVQYDGIEVTEDEIKEKYDEMLEDNAFEIAASHILFDKEDKEKAEKVKKELDEGADFAELAKEHSKDTSAENGGQLGYFGKGRMVEEFDEAAFSLKLDEISDIVESEHGYHIIKVTDLPTFEDKKEVVRLELMQSKIDPAELQSKLDKLLQGANIDIKIDEFKDLFQFLDEAENDPTPEVDEDNNEDNNNNNANDNENNK